MSMVEPSTNTNDRAELGQDSTSAQNSNPTNTESSLASSTSPTSSSSANRDSLKTPKRASSSYLDSFGELWQLASKPDKVPLTQTFFICASLPVERQAEGTPPLPNGAQRLHPLLDEQKVSGERQNMPALELGEGPDVYPSPSGNIVPPLPEDNSWKLGPPPLKAPVGNLDGEVSNFSTLEHS